MKKKIIIFDMDGVLFDTIPFAKETFLKRHPGVTREMYDEIHTGNYHEEAKRYSHFKIQETDEEQENHKINYAEQKSQTQLFEGIKSLLEELHNEGYLLTINTNAYNKNCLPLLENSGIKLLFDFIATAEFSKDKVEKFTLIQDKYKVEKEDILFITDALGDVRDADIAGVPAVAVTWGVHDKTFFEREKHSHLIGVVDTVENLLGFIETYFNSGI